MTEKQLLEAIRQLAEWSGYLAYHTHVSRRREPGFPDLVLVGHGQVIFAELKSAAGALTTDQARWRDKLRVCGADWRLWTPAEWESGEIEETLTGSAGAHET